MSLFFSLLLSKVGTAPTPIGTVLHYTATQKVNPDETAFNVSIVSNTFTNGVGTIVFDGILTTIGDNAFNGCYQLTAISIPNTVESIGDGAFDGCISLQTVSIPTSVETIGYEAFNDCENLTSVNIPNSVTWIGDYAFWGCVLITEMTFTRSTPPTIFVDTLPPNIEHIYVPDDSVVFYRSANVWIGYADIIEPIGGSVTPTITSGILTFNMDGDAWLGLQGSGFRLSSGGRNFKIYLENNIELNYSSTNIVVSISNVSVDVTQVHGSTPTTNDNVLKIRRVTDLSGNTLMTFTEPQPIESSVIEYTTNNGLTIEPYGTNPFNVPVLSNEYTDKGRITFSGILTTATQSVRNNGNLVTIKFPEGLVELKGANFIYSRAIEQIDLPSTLTKIGSEELYQSGSPDIIIRAANPPLLAPDSNLYLASHIYVPASRVSTYKIQWIDLASKISAITT